MFNIKIKTGEHKGFVFKAKEENGVFYYNWEDESFSVNRKDVEIL